jgi:hypothetical protein
MNSLIVIKCRKINDFVGLMNATLEDDIGFGVDLENNTIFTSDIEIMTKDTRNLFEFLTRGYQSVCGQWFRYYIDYMPIWDEGLPRIDVRPVIVEKCKEWADYKLEDLLRFLRSVKNLGPRQIDLVNLSYLEIIPDKLKVFIDSNSKIFYKTGGSQREYQIDLDLPLFEDSPVPVRILYPFTIRNALKHLLNFSYPE